MPVPLMSQVRKKRVLAGAWRVILSNGRSSPSKETRREIEAFALDSDIYLDRIQRQLNRNKFKFGPARGVPIPKKDRASIRPIVVAPIESRIVQRAIHDVLLRVPVINGLANHPFSFGGIKKTKGQTDAGVPAAIKAVLAAIHDGATYAIRSDISAFFTRIPKPAVIKIVSDAVNDPEFLELFKQALTVELENIAQLMTIADEFPLGEIGVAQGSSLSPLMGNLLLYDFDQQMNSGKCRCIRYIDDFLIIASDQYAADSAFSEASRLLKRHGLSTSASKTFPGPISKGFEFLGIEIGNGRITPNKTSRERLISKVGKELGDSLSSMRSNRSGKGIDAAHTLVRTLMDVSGIVNGWGHHYSFCNERNVIRQLDDRIDGLLQDYSQKYARVRNSSDAKAGRRLLGVPLLEELATQPLTWPTLNTK